MEFRFLCPFCGQKLKANHETAGKAVDCPHCQNEFLVPEPLAEDHPQAPSAVPEPNAEGEHIVRHSVGGSHAAKAATGSDIGRGWRPPESRPTG